MSASDANVPVKRTRWAVIAFVALAGVLIGMKCLCPDPSAAFRQQVTGAAEVRGSSLRAAVAPSPSAPVASVETAASASPQRPAAAPVASPPVVASTPTPVAAAPSPAPAPLATPKAPESPKPEPTVAKAAEAMHADNSSAKTITWDDISKYTYVPPDPDAEDATSVAAATKDKPKTDQIPESIRAMSGKRYVIEGFAVPLDYEKGIVTKFILLPAPLACCFAEAPPMNRWIMVSNDAKSEFDYSKYGRLRASGVFDVGEETREGYVVGIYRMKAEKVENVEQ
jgi:hypothetical protein